jgi:hypothetical protein
MAGADLQYADLTGANLSGVNLTGTDLTGANLFKVNLSHANLRGVNLAEADLTDANLSGADLTGANLTDADLTDAILEGVVHSNVRGTALPAAKPAKLPPAPKPAPPSPAHSKHTSVLVPPQLSGLVSVGPDLMKSDEYLRHLLKVPGIQSAINSGLINLSVKGPYTIRVDYKTPSPILRGSFREDGTEALLQKTQQLLESLIDRFPGWAPARHAKLSKFALNEDWRTRTSTAYSDVSPGLTTFFVRGKERLWPQGLKLRVNGSVEYSLKVPDRDVERAFARALAEAAPHVRYHEGYSGTIGEADGYKVMSKTPVLENLVDRAIEKYGTSGKRGPAYAIPYTEATTQTLTVKLSFEVPAQDAEDEDLRQFIKEKKIEAAVAATGHSKESIESISVEGTVTIPPVRWVFHPTPGEPLHRVWPYYSQHTGDGPETAHGSLLLPIPQSLEQFTSSTGSLTRKESVTADHRAGMPGSHTLTKTDALGVLVPEFSGNVIYNLVATVTLSVPAGGGIKGWYFWGSAPR